MLGKLLGFPLRLVNAPLRAVEDLITFGSDEAAEEDRLVSKPLDALAKQLENLDE